MRSQPRIAVAETWRQFASLEERERYAVEAVTRILMKTQMTQ
jgi:hypothetical protein